MNRAIKMKKYLLALTMIFMSHYCNANTPMMQSELNTLGQNLNESMNAGKNENGLFESFKIAKHEYIFQNQNNHLTLSFK